MLLISVASWQKLMSLQKDYTGGQLPELIDIIIKSKASLFVCAVGVPPKWAVDKLHAAGIPVMKYVLLNFRFYFL
jgi:NAD(P)H-dependent flavin oxidoreductase YrpB (nitropropane dioxygenase family)